MIVIGVRVDELLPLRVPPTPQRGWPKNTNDSLRTVS
jgi:hypothetical protein